MSQQNISHNYQIIHEEDLEEEEKNFRFDNEQITDDQEFEILTLFMETIKQKLKNKTISKNELSNLYSFMIKFNKATKRKEEEDEEEEEYYEAYRENENEENEDEPSYADTRNIMKYYILGWYISQKL